MIINDERGNERSGYGLLKVGDRYRVVLGLDSAQGREGLTLGLSDEAGVGMTVRDAKGAVWTGSAPPGDATTGLTEAFRGFLTRGADGVHVIAGSNDGK
jgi:hypothetical protein